MKTQKLNDIEVSYEIPTTPVELRQLADRIEHLEKTAYPGQTIRIRIDHKFHAIYKVTTLAPVATVSDHVTKGQLDALVNQ